MAQAQTKLTQAQAQKISAYVQANQPSAAEGSFPWPRLEAALGVKTPAEAQAVSAQALKQTGYTDSQISSILVLPHGTNVEALVGQDITGILAGIGFGSGGLFGDDPAAGAGDDTTGGDTGGDSTSGSDDGTSGGTSGKALAGATAVSGLAGILGGTGWSELLIRALEALAALALLALGLQALTGVDATGTAAKAAGAAAVA